jgi:hypothetical protein
MTGHFDRQVFAAKSAKSAHFLGFFFTMLMLVFQLPGKKNYSRISCILHPVVFLHGVYCSPTERKFAKFVATLRLKLDFGQLYFRRQLLHELTDIAIDFRLHAGFKW